jgi:hypothetical protein
MKAKRIAEQEAKQPKDDYRQSSHAFKHLNVQEVDICFDPPDAVGGNSISVGSAMITPPRDTPLRIRWI